MQANFGLLDLDQMDEQSGMGFIISSMINRIQTVTLVQVKGVNASGVSPVGTVNVQPLVAQLDGQGGIHQHGVIYNIPYFRLQGGSNAIIIDPKVGDIGMCGFCSRDISSVKNNKSASAPGSYRRFDYADGLYFGGFLNGTPSQYVFFKDSGIDIFSTGEITMRGSKVTIDAPVETTATITAGGDVSGGGVSLMNHIHGGVQTGSGKTEKP